MLDTIDLTSGSIGTSDESLASASPATARMFANVLGVRVDALDMEQALAMIAERLESRVKGYVCAVSVHGVLEALRNSAVADALAGAAMALPDGTPTVWVGWMQGHTAMDAVTGPAIMREILRRRHFAGYSHFFYGGKPGVAEELASTLKTQFPWARVAGCYTPPFRDLTEDEEASVVATINARRPDVIWVGISTPRQDLFMRRMVDRVDTRLMFGVGAAFDFLTGRIHDCPAWIKRAGLHWLHRLAQDPRRLWRRNAANSAFLGHIFLQLSRLRAYLPHAATDSCRSCQ